MLESGAYNGLTYSNSYGPVRDLGWRAIHVESARHNFINLVESRPESVNIHAALCDREAVVHVTAQNSAVGYCNQAPQGIEKTEPPLCACVG